MRKWLLRLIPWTACVLMFSLSQFTFNMSWKFGFGFIFGNFCVYGVWAIQQWLEFRWFGKDLRRIGHLLEDDMNRLEVILFDPLIMRGVSNDPEIQSKFQELTNLVREKQVEQIAVLKTLQ